MELKEYQRFAALGIHDETQKREPIVAYALGLIGESGEVVDDIKKRVFHGRDIPLEHTTEELGDVLWYVANIATYYGLSLEDIIRNNVAKLKKRYPEKYNTADLCFYDGRRVSFKITGPHVKMCDAVTGEYIKFLNAEEKKTYGFSNTGSNQSTEGADDKLPWD